MTTTDFPYRSTIMKNDLGFIYHCHREAEILFVLEGELYARNETQTFHLKKGDILIFMPFENHEIFKRENYSERLCVQFGLEQAALGIKDMKEYSHIMTDFVSVEPYSEHWDWRIREDVKNLIRRMHREYKEQNSTWRLAITGLIIQIALCGLREIPRREKPINGKNVEKLKNALKYISNHYEGDITLTGCAGEIGFNSTYFSRYFKMHMAISFQEYVKCLRIEKAKWLLITKDLTITEICFQSGFNDVKTFNKHFLALCGKNPTQFRKDNRILFHKPY